MGNKAIKEARQRIENLERQNAQLNGEISSTKRELGENRKKYENLESSHKNLQQQNIELEEKYNLQLNTLKKELQNQNEKVKELLRVKEEFDVMCLDLERNKKRIQELEHELQLSTDEARKFEEMHKQSASQAESEAKKVSELERLLEDAKRSIRGMEDEMASLQEELKVANDKIVEYQKVEEALKTTTAELSAVQEELALTKSKLLEVEHRLSLKDSFVNKLTQELILRKTAQLKEDIFGLQHLFSSTMKELHEKISDLRNAKFKLQEEENLRESVEAAFKPREGQVLAVRKERGKLDIEKKGLEATVADLTGNEKQFKELCTDLQYSDENFRRTELLLSQALLNNAKLGQKVKSLEELQNVVQATATIASQKNYELEGQIQATTAAAEEARSQLRELETRFRATEKKNVELEQHLNSVQLKFNETERDVTKFTEKMSELNAKLLEAEEELVSHKNTASKLHDLQSKADEIQKANEAKIFALEDKLKEQKNIEDALRSEVENLRTEITEKSILQNRLKKIEENLIKSGYGQKEEVRGVQAVTSQTEAQLSSKLEDYAQRVRERDLLNETAVELEKELQLEIVEKSMLQNRLKEIEEQLRKSESSQNEQIGSDQAVASQREPEDYAHKVRERDLLNEVDVELEKELQPKIVEKSMLENQLEEIEEQLIKSESRQNEEVRSVQAVASQREAELSSKLKDHAHKVHERDLLNEMAVEPEKELQLQIVRC